MYIHQQPGGRAALVQLYAGGCITVEVPTNAELSGAAAIPMLGACGSTMDAREPTWTTGRP